MTGLPYAILRAASLLAPSGRRAEWLKEWRSELWYIPSEDAARFCLGAFRDAVWVRRHQARAHRQLLESPWTCIAVLVGAGCAALLAAICLPAPELPVPGARLHPRDLPGGCLAMLAMSMVFLPGIRLAMGPVRRSPHHARARTALFFALKFLLVQPVLLASFIVLLLTGPHIPILPQLFVFAIWGFTLRWVLLDQRRRCPVCLRLLGDPVRIGSASETFLEWYGGESVCLRGHGMLQEPEFAHSYSAARRWLDLDDSWRGLFSDAPHRP